MSLDIGTLIGHLQLDAAAFDAGLTKAKTGMKSTGESAQAAGKQIETSMTSSLQRAMQQVDQIGQQGKRAVTLLQGPPEKLAAVAKAAGTSVDDLKVKLQGMAAEAKESGQAVESSAGGISSKFKDFAKVTAAAFAGTAIFNFAKDSISAFADAQAKTQELEDAYAKFPALGDTTAAAIEKITKALEVKTGIDDDATNAAAATLAQFDLTGKQIETLLPLLEDYAAKTKTDVGTAATNLGRALDGNTRGLKTVGINYTSTGDKATDFANIIGALNDKIGGFAENQGKTAAGQLQILKSEFGELEESVGSAVIPALGALAQVAVPIITGLSTDIGDLVGWFQQLPGPIRDAALAFGAFTLANKLGFIGKLKDGFGGLVTAVKSVKSEFAAGLAGDVETAGAKFGALATEAEGASAEIVAAATAAKEAWAGVPGAVASGEAAGAAGAAGAGGEAVAVGKTAATGAAGGLFVNPVTLTLGALTVANIVATSLSVDAINANAAKTGGKQVTGGEVAAAQSAASASTPGLFGGGIDILGIGRQKDAVKDTNAALTDGAAAFATWTGAARDAEDASETAFAKMQLGAGKARGAIQDGTGTWKAYGQSIPVSALQALHDGLSGAQEVAVRTNQAIQYNAKNWKVVGDAAGVATTSVDLFSAAMDRLAGRNGDAAAASRAAQEAIRAVGGAYRDQQSAVDAVTQAQIDLQAAQDKKTGSDYTAQQKTLDVAAAQRSLKDAQDGVKDSADKLAEAQDAVVSTADQQVLSVYKSTLAHQGYTKAVDAAKAKMEDERQAFIDQAVAAGQSKDAAEKLADKLGLIPKNVETTVSANTSQAIKDVDLLATRVAKLHGKTITIYTNQINQGGKAGSGVGYSTGFASGTPFVTGGTPGRDSVPAMLMPGEAVIPTDKSARYHGLINAMMSGTIPGFASGYLPPTAASLAGVSSPNFGPVKSAFLDAYQTYASAVAATRDVYTDAARAATDAVSKFTDQRQAEADTAKQQAENVAEARKSQAETAKDQAAKVVAARRDAAERVSDAAARVKSAKTRAARASAETALAKTQREASESVSKALAAQSKANTAAADKTSKAVAAQHQANAAEDAKTAAAKKAMTVAKQAALVDKERYAATADVVAKSQALVHIQSALSGALDSTNAKLSTARDKLSTLLGDKSQLASSISQAVAGAGGGILGFSAQRTSGASILNGLQYDLRKAQGFQSGISKLAGLGLNTQDLEALAGAGVDQGGTTVAALAGSSKATIAAINATEAKIRAAATATGNVVAAKAYDAQIKAQEKVVTDFKAQVDRLTGLLAADAKILRTDLVKAVSGITLKTDNQTLAKAVAKGQAELTRR